MKDTKDDEWYISWKQNFLYNDQDLLTDVLESYYILFWREYWKAEYQYDEQDNMINFSSFYYETDITEWINDETEEYFYNEANNLIAWSEKEWDDTENVWINSDKEDYSYAPNGGLSKLLDYNWNDASNDWEEAWKEEYTYDQDFAYEEIMLPWFFHDDYINFFNHAMTEYQRVIYKNNEWVPDAKGNYYYSGITSTTTIAENSNDKIHIFPNPTKNELLISGNLQSIRTLRIFDMTGRLLMTASTFQNQPVALQDLRSGFYILQLLDATNKLIHNEKIQIID